MFIWAIFFVCDLLAPFLMIGFGRQLWKHPPEKINSEWGYRTKRSMQNADTWRFAQTVGGRWIWRLGWAALALSVLAQVLLYGKSAETVAYAGFALWAAQLALLLLAFPLTERALGSAFTNDGLRR